MQSKKKNNKFSITSSKKLNKMNKTSLKKIKRRKHYTNRRNKSLKKSIGGMQDTTLTISSNVLPNLKNHTFMLNKNALTGLFSHSTSLTFQDNYLTYTTQVFKNIKEIFYSDITSINIEPNKVIFILSKPQFVTDLRFTVNSSKTEDFNRFKEVLQLFIPQETIVKKKNKINMALVVPKCSEQDINGCELGKGSFGSITRHFCNQEFNDLQDRPSFCSNNPIFVKKTQNFQRNKSIIQNEEKILKTLELNDYTLNLLNSYLDEPNYIFELSYISGYDLGTTDGYPIFKVEKNELFQQNKDLIISQLFQGLNFIHTKNILHLDIQGCNIRVSVNETNVKPIYMDFGLSKLLNERDDRNLPLVRTTCNFGIGGGRFRYPFEKKNNLFSELSDFYALGMTIGENIEGNGPDFIENLTKFESVDILFSTENTKELMLKQCNDDTEYISLMFQYIQFRDKNIKMILKEEIIKKETAIEKIILSVAKETSK